MDANELAKDIYEVIVKGGITGIDERAFVPIVADMIRQREDGWISVKDRLPKNCSDVLCMDSIGRYCIGHLTPSKDGWWIDERKVYLSYVTHWQPLPPAPEGER